MRNKTILHITPFFAPNIGGVETHLSDLTAKLDELKYKNIVLTYSPITTPNVRWCSREKFGKRSNIRRFYWIGFNFFHRLEKYPLINLFYITPYLLFRSLIWIFVYQPKIDVLHSHGVNGAIIGIILKKIFRVPIHVVSIYSSYDNVPINKTSSKFMVSILNRADKVLTQSRQSVEQLIFMGVKLKKLGIYRHWIDLKQFQPMNKTALRKKFGLEDKFSVIFIGRMLPYKGALVLANAAVKLPRINFFFVGEGPEYQTIKKIAETHENIVLFGNIPYQQLHIYYNLADVFCLPSLYKEGWGRVIMEALACGLPVVASNRGAIAEVVDESVAIVAEPTSKNLEISIKALYENRREFQKLRRSSIKFARRRFSDRNISSITKHYS